jgi:hypothetical protein
MATGLGDRHNELAQRIKSLRASFHIAADPEERNRLLDELGTATRELTELILRQEGRLRSPLE